VRGTWKTWTLLFGGLVVLSLTAGGCSESPEATKAEMDYNAQNQERLVKAVPPPVLTDSQERRNLVKRYATWNNPNKLSWIVLISYGKVMATYTVKGKVSYVSSQLTCPQQIVWYNSSQSHAVESPEPDGSYGQNGDAIFFFSVDGAYHEYKGEYLVSDQPFQLQTPPQIVASVNLEKKGK
jgi:hypothetical protein